LDVRENGYKLINEYYWAQVLDKKASIGVFLNIAYG